MTSVPDDRAILLPQRLYSASLVQPEASGDRQPTHCSVIFFRICPPALYWFGDEPFDRFIRVFHRVFIPDSSRKLC